MSIRDLIPSGRGSSAASSDYRGGRHPFFSLHREMNRLFDDFFHDFDAPMLPRGFGAAGSNWPNVEISDSEKELRVTAEVPGMEEKDIEVLLDDGVLTLRGEKKGETEDKDRKFSERFYGRFERRIPVGADIQEEKVKASFTNGVLSVTLPKNEKAQAKAKRISIESRN